MTLRALLCGWCFFAALGAQAQESKKPQTGNPETVGGSGSTVDIETKSAPTNDLRVVPQPEIAPAPAPVAPAPAPKPAAPPAHHDTGPIIKPPVQAGDEWIYRRVSGTGTVLLRQRVTGVNENGISLRTELAGSIESTTAVYDREWGLLGSGYNDYLPALNYYAFSLYPGKRWRINAGVSNFGAGQKSRISGEGTALAFEEITVAAGRFTALKIIVEMEISDPGDAARIVRVKETHWYVREVMRPVRVESVTQLAAEAARVETIELVSYRLE